MIEFPIWAIVALSALALPTAALILMVIADVIIDAIDGARGRR